MCLLRESRSTDRTKEETKMATQSSRNTEVMVAIEEIIIMMTLAMIRKEAQEVITATREIGGAAESLIIETETKVVTETIDRAVVDTGIKIDIIIGLTEMAADETTEAIGTIDTPGRDQDPTLSIPEVQAPRIRKVVTRTADKEEKEIAEVLTMVQNHQHPMHNQ